jgi:hypothetical protein
MDDLSVIPVLMSDGPSVNVYIFTNEYLSVNPDTTSGSQSVKHNKF